MLYKVFGLFPFYVKDVDGTFTLVKGNTLIDGCYNQLACNFTLPNNVNDDDEFSVVELTVNNTTLLEAGKTYSFQTIYKYYLKYKHLKTNIFIKWVRNGLGVKRILRPSDIPQSTWNEYELVPEYVNLAECESLHEDMVHMKLLCDIYTQHQQRDGDINCEMECMLAKYAKMGGDYMKDKYLEYADEADGIAEKWLTYASPDMATYDIDINIVKTDKNSGVPSYNGEYVVPTDGTAIVVTGHSNSKLRSFRKYTDYISPMGYVETPGINEDWLFYYRKNALANYTVNRDSDGNIAILGEDNTRNENVNDYDTHLDAHGDILIDIVPNQDDKTITFIYVLGAHLKAELTAKVPNELNKTIYYYGNFEYCDGGVEYVETYSYGENSDLNTLVTDGHFNNYVNDTYHDYSPYVRYEFDISGTIHTETAEINGQQITFSYQQTSFTAIMEPKQFNYTPILTPDYYVGFDFQPQISNGIAFSRGNAAAFERHIKLGEIKSFDDFMNYSNGGFFNVL